MILVIQTSKKKAECQALALCRGHEVCWESFWWRQLSLAGTKQDTACILHHFQGLSLLQLVQKILSLLLGLCRHQSRALSAYWRPDLALDLLSWAQLSVNIAWPLSLTRVEKSNIRFQRRPLWGFHSLLVRVWKYKYS